MREEILDLATRQLKKGGYSHLSFKTIAEILHTTRANIHYHFESKERLAKEVLIHFIHESRRVFQQKFKAHQKNFPRAITDIETTFWHMLEASNGEGGCACSPFVTNAEEVPVELREMALNYFQGLIGDFEQQIKASQESGTVDGKLDAGVLATEAMCMLIGFMNLARLDFMRREKNPHVRTVLNTWSRSIKPRSVQTSKASR